MKRERALELLHAHVGGAALRGHCVASEAVMRALARRFGEDEEAWGLAGLLHDLDFETTQDDMTRHGLDASRLLAGEGLAEPLCHAIAAHNASHTGVERSCRLDVALTCAESITGLIVACALVQPDRRLASVKPASVLKRMKKKDFARTVDRDEIRLCETIDVPLDEFAALAVEAMQSVATDLGL